MTYQALAKGTLLIESGPQHDKERKHLYIICSDPCSEGKQVVVPICSWHERADETCILHGFEHSFLKHKSFVFYARAAIYETRALELGVKEGHFSPHDDIATAYHLKVVKGLCKSIQTPRRIKSYLGCSVPESVDLAAGAA